MAKVVSSEQYAEIGRMLQEANLLSEQSRQAGLTLAQKVELQRKAKALREQAMEIGQ